MLVIAIISIIISAILFFIIKKAIIAHKNKEIVIYYDGWDLSFNLIVYLLPLILLFFIDSKEINRSLFYCLTCFGFTVLMGVSAYQCNKNSIGKFLTALFIKICIGIETIAALITFIVILFLILTLFSSDKKQRRRS